MTPAAQQELDRHVQAIAKLLYADANIRELKSLNDIEVTIRNQVQTHVTPQIGLFLSKALPVAQKDTPAS